jgi:hypothetical protein
MKANSGNDSSGHESKSGALRSKMADEMFTMKNQWFMVAAIPLHEHNHFQNAATTEVFMLTGAVFQRRFP